MKYMGSKSRFTKELLPIILKDRNSDQFYIEPFAGGMNMICEVDGKRIANDSNFYLIELWKKLIDGWIPSKISKQLYDDVNLNRDKFEPFFVGWVGFNCSYSGKWFAGFAGDTETKIGTMRDYQQEAIKNVMKQIPKLQDVIFCNKQYYELELPTNSVIYCDPPYKGTTQYKDKFDHEYFWNYVRDLKTQGHTVFVSEYDAPCDFTCIWEKKTQSSLSANGKVGGNKVSIERLFK